MNWLEFFKEWSPYLVSGLIVVLDFLILLSKRRPKTIDDFMFYLQEVLNRLPEFIDDAEVVLSSSKDKPKKKNYVINNAMLYFSRLLKRDISASEYDIAEKAISEQIESILSTPQKKGVHYGTK